MWKEEKRKKEGKEKVSERKGARTLFGDNP
jgi:hypothetical protein